MIPILDLKDQYKAIKTEVDSAIQAVLDGGHFIMGPNVAALESELAAFIGTPHCISMNSGTDALHLAFRALDIGPGDEVITTPFTFVATTEAIGIVGATPVFVDIDPQTLNIDPAKIEAAITERTKAILPVHLYGAPAAMNEIMRIARKHSLAVVEDCAQAIGGSIAGKQVGTFGDVGCFSFFPTKNLGAYGDGGMACTSDSRLQERLKALRVHGGATKYYHDELGVNSRLDELQAAVLRVKLRHLESWTDQRRAVAARYGERLQDVPGLRIPVSAESDRHVYHQYTVIIKDRDAIRRQLLDAGIQTMVYYPVPLHLQNVNAALGLRAGSFPESERAAAEVLSLPMYPELQQAAQETVVATLRSLCAASVVNA